MQTDGFVPKSFVGANDGAFVGDAVGALVVTPLREQVAGGSDGGQYDEFDAFPFANCKMHHVVVVVVVVVAGSNWYLYIVMERSKSTQRYRLRNPKRNTLGKVLQKHCSFVDRKGSHRMAETILPE